MGGVMHLSLFVRKPTGRNRVVLVWTVALVLSFLAFPALAQETQGQGQEPAPPPEPVQPVEEEQISDPPEEAPPEGPTPDDEKLSIEELKALSDDDLEKLYLETPWLLPDEFGEDEELLERVMSLVHPELEEETAETTPKPKPQPDAH